ncbi:MAG: hypothetical protein WED00_18550 [Aquisalimonadaceae bacterium]
MNETPRHRDRLVVLFLLGFLAFNYPLLSLFATDDRVFGLPVLYVYLFSIWGVFIFLTWWLVGRHREAGGGRSQSRPRER